LKEKKQKTLTSIVVPVVMTAPVAVVVDPDPIDGLD
jgi:hypothetical protein